MGLQEAKLYTVGNALSDLCSRRNVQGMVLMRGSTRLTLLVHVSQTKGSKARGLGIKSDGSGAEEKSESIQRHNCNEREKSL